MRASAKDAYVGSSIFYAFARYSLETHPLSLDLLSFVLLVNSDITTLPAMDVVARDKYLSFFFFASDKYLSLSVIITSVSRRFTNNILVVRVYEESFSSGWRSIFRYFWIFVTFEIGFFFIQLYVIMDNSPFILPGPT